MTRTTAPNITTTAFYGEETPWPVADVIHCEQLSLRSAMYDWQIKPHRHIDLVQLFFIMDGQGDAKVDDRRLTLGSGSLLVVPAGCVHTFMWAEGSNGYVLFIARPLLSEMEANLGNLPWCYDEACYVELGDDRDWLQTLLSNLCLEYQNQRPQRQLMLQHLTSSLFIWANREHQKQRPEEGPSKSKSEQRLESFLRLLERQFQHHHEVEWYAQRVGITASHLNTICRSQLQQSALQIIHKRLLTEAQRHLIYTGKPVSQVADGIGFNDPAYFNRFFKRLTGSTPAAFRKTHLEQ